MSISETTISPSSVALPNLACVQFIAESPLPFAEALTQASYQAGKRRPAIWRLLETARNAGVEVPGMPETYPEDPDYERGTTPADGPVLHSERAMWMQTVAERSSGITKEFAEQSIPRLDNITSEIADLDRTIAEATAAKEQLADEQRKIVAAVEALDGAQHSADALISST